MTFVETVCFPILQYVQPAFDLLIDLLIEPFLLIKLNTKSSLLVPYCRVHHNERALRQIRVTLHLTR